MERPLPAAPRDKQTVAVGSLIAAAGLTVLKALVGVLTGSLGPLA